MTITFEVWPDFLKKIKNPNWTLDPPLPKTLKDQMSHSENFFIFQQ